MHEWADILPIPLALIGLLFLGVPFAAQDLVRRPERVHKAWWIVASPALFPAVVAIGILRWGRFGGVVEAMPYLAQRLHIHLVALAALQLGMALCLAGSRGLRSTVWARRPLLALIPGVSGRAARPYRLSRSTPPRPGRFRASQQSAQALPVRHACCAAPTGLISDEITII